MHPGFRTLRCLIGSHWEFKFPAPFFFHHNDPKFHKKRCKILGSLGPEITLFFAHLHSVGGGQILLCFTRLLYLKKSFTYILFMERDMLVAWELNL